MEGSKVAIENIKLKLVESIDELEPIYEDLLPLYQDIYSAAPDFQFWSESFIKEAFVKYFNYGKILLAFDGPKVIGFCVNMPFVESKVFITRVYSQPQTKNEENGQIENYTNEENLENFLLDKYNVVASECRYLADFGVHKDYRKVGIGSKLFDDCINLTKSLNLVIRASTRKQNVIDYYVRRNFLNISLYQYPVYNYLDGTSGLEEKLILVKTVLTVLNN
jgi:ribosomal protein S18 acetylase RimI-like enzyme